MQKIVFVAMSGGVDSSVAAALLKERGFSVVGVHIKCFNLDGCGEKDAEDARRVAEQLKIPFYVFSLEKEYKERVVEYMIDGYKKGITPNPDMMCNKEIKFGLFLKRALELGVDYIATGHYVKIFKIKDLRLKITNYGLRIARDKNKDQSYFLWTLTQNQLKYCLFPIGEYIKPQVRKLAKKFNLLTAEKKDSQGICFLGKITLTDFLKDYISEKKGLVLNTAGKKIGEHKGAYFYTIGQRSGLGIGGFDRPYYIAEKNIQINTITIVEGQENLSLYKKEIKLTNVNFINSQSTIHNSKFIIPVFVRVRYRQPLNKAILRKMANGKWQILFNESQKFVAPGQSAVFYNEDGEMLGGGVII